MKIERLLIRNYKSIQKLDLTFNQINIMIGGNGVGKSNLISYFKFLNKIVNSELNAFVAQQNGADDFLYFGRKTSERMASRIYFENKSYENYYDFSLIPTNDDGFVFLQEKIAYLSKEKWIVKDIHKSGSEETNIHGYNEEDTNIFGTKRGISHYILDAFKSFKIYHFHDTSDTAKLKGYCPVDDNRFLREDASNLAAFLYLLQEKFPTNFKQIEGVIKTIAPYFSRFNLNRNQLNPERIRLEWLEQGSDKYFNAHSLSDGTLRMMCLVTLLLQPAPPATIIIDEPELGLHPMAIQLLASIIKSASLKTQIITSTQSVTLINQFTPDDVIVVERENGESVFRHIGADELEGWKEDYALGEIWEKNLIGGRP